MYTGGAAGRAAEIRARLPVASKIATVTAVVGFVAPCVHNCLRISVKERLNVIVVVECERQDSPLANQPAPNLHSYGHSQTGNDVHGGEQPDTVAFSSVIRPMTSVATSSAELRGRTCTLRGAGQRRR